MNIRARIEITQGSQVKYEHDIEKDCLVVDRFLTTSAVYPANYGYIPDTLSEDGDPIDVVVLCEHELLPGTELPIVVIGALLTVDEKGRDPKILAVPHPRLRSFYSKMTDINDISDIEKSRISHFFETYKQNEPGKFSEVGAWQTANEATDYIRTHGHQTTQ